MSGGVLRRATRCTRPLRRTTTPTRRPQRRLCQVLLRWLADANPAHKTQAAAIRVTETVEMIAGLGP